MNVIRGPGELVALVPSLLGFEPADSVVVVLVREHGNLATLMRVDLADLLSDDAIEIALGMAREAAHESARLAVGLAYAQDELAGRLALEPVVAALADTVGTVEEWVVADGRYFCPRCTDPRCCPPGGRDVPAVGAGGDPCDALRWRVGADPGVTRADSATRRLCGRAATRWERRAERDLAGWRRTSCRTWLAALDSGASGPAPLGRLAAGLADVRVRDAVLLALVPQAERAVEDALEGRDSRAVGDALGAGMRPQRRPDPDRTDSLVALAHALLAHAPARLCAAPAAVLAVVAWWEGEASEARAWCTIALDHDPGYRLALLVLALINAEAEAGPGLR